MPSDGASRWKPLERLSPTLFLAAAPMVLIAVTLAGLRGFTSFSVPYIVFWPFLPLGFAVSLVGLAGLHPRLVDNAPSSAKIGTGFAVFGAGLLLAGSVGLLLLTPSGPYPENLGSLGPLFFFGFIAVIPAFATYGIASLRTATPSQQFGGLLLGVGLLQFVNMFGPAIVRPILDVGHHGGLVFQMVVYGLATAIFLALGYGLRTEATATATTDTADAPV